jgi:hypothetical protein
VRFIVFRIQFIFKIALTGCMIVNYVVGHEWASSLFLCIVSILWVLKIFWCKYVKYSKPLLYKGDDLRLAIFACYSWGCGCYSWEANICLVSQNILGILWSPKVHYGVNKSLPLVSIMSQMSLVHTFPFCFLRIYFNIILAPTPESSQCSLAFRVSCQYFVYTSLCFNACYMHCPSNSS